MSVTIQGLIVAILGWLMTRSGVPFIEGDIETFVSVGASIIGALMVYWGRFRKGDISPLGFRK